MKYAFAALALAAVAQAQTLADIPKCAIPCLDASITKNTDCKISDIACVCKNFDKVQGDATSCVLDKCGSDVALNDVLPAAEALCKNPPSGDDSSASASETESEPSSTGASYSSASASSSAVAPAPEKPTPEPTPVPLPSPTDVVIPPSNTKPEPTPVETGAASTFGSMGALAMAALAVLAL